MVLLNRLPGVGFPRRVGRVAEADVHKVVELGDGVGGAPRQFGEQVSELDQKQTKYFRARIAKEVAKHVVVKRLANKYREVNKGLYVVARHFFLILLNCSAWLCLGPA